MTGRSMPTSLPRLSQTARLDEIALHVDDDAAPWSRLEGVVVGFGFQGQAQACSSGRPGAVAAISDAESATQPKTPPCIVTIFSAAEWLPGSVAPVRVQTGSGIRSHGHWRRASWCERIHRW